MARAGRHGILVDPVEATQQAETPTAVLGRINGALRAVGDGWVEGEVQNLSPSASGHAYYQITDGRTSISCVTWRGQLGRLREQGHGDAIRNGNRVRAHFTKVDVYAKGSKASLHVDRIERTGEGELLRRAAEWLGVLVAEGLTDAGRKPPLPVFPRRIGLITGEGADAYHDVVTAVRARFPIARFAHRPALVQGARHVVGHELHLTVIRGRFGRIQDSQAAPPGVGRDPQLVPCLVPDEQCDGRFHGQPARHLCID